MRAQNEPPALEVRAREPVGEPTDVPGAYVVERVDPARMRAMSRASQLAALVVGSRAGRADPRRVRRSRRQDGDARAAT